MSRREQRGQSTDAVVAKWIARKIDELELQGIADKAMRQKLKSGIVQADGRKVNRHKLVSVSTCEKVGQ